MVIYKPYSAHQQKQPSSFCLLSILLNEKPEGIKNLCAYANILTTWPVIFIFFDSLYTCQALDFLKVNLSIPVPVDLITMERSSSTPKNRYLFQKNAALIHIV